VVNPVKGVARGGKGESTAGALGKGSSVKVRTAVPHCMLDWGGDQRHDERECPDVLPIEEKKIRERGFGVKKIVSGEKRLGLS